MKIGVISDTHLSKPTEALYELQHGVFADVSIVLHAGDLTELDVLQAFSGKEVVAVSGNMDSPVVKNQLPSKRIIEVAGFRIGLTHVWGKPFTSVKGLMADFDQVNAIVYGHTHRAVNEVRGGILFFNPGAFYSRPAFPAQGSVGILTLGEELSGQIIRV
jgi:putative phosphoesterase